MMMMMMIIIIIVRGMDHGTLYFCLVYLISLSLSLSMFKFDTYESFRYDHTPLGSTIQNTCHLTATLFKKWRYFQRQSQSSGSPQRYQIPRNVLYVYMILMSSVAS